ADSAVAKENLKWAREVAAEFATAWAAGDTIRARTLLSAELKKVLQTGGNPISEEKWLNQPGDGHFRGGAPSSACAELAPGGEEALFQGSFADREQFQKVEFQLRLIKEKGWRVLSFRSVACPTPVQKLRVKLDDRDVASWAGWYPDDRLHALGLG